jgi:F-type H+-transporting ATPase subunit b
MNIITDILNLFGIETEIFIAQIINFAILLIILKLLLYKPIAQILKEREDKIKKGLDDAKKAEEDLRIASTQKTEILKNARKDADKIIEITKQSVQNIKQKATDDAKKQAVEIVENAKRSAKEEQEKASKKVGLMSIDISKKVVSKILSEIFTEKEKTEILSRAINKIEHSGYEKTNN